MISMIRNTATKFGSFSKVMHWSMAGMIFALIIIGIYMGDLPRVTDEEKQFVSQLYAIHKSFGVFAMLFMAIRLAWITVVSPNPPLPALFTGRERILIEAIKTALYLMMIMLPLSGYLMSNANGHTVTIFGLFELPMVISQGQTSYNLLQAIHMIGGWLMLLIILAHVAGVIKHYLEDEGTEKDVLQRML